MHLHAIPTVERGHHRLRSGCERGTIALRVNINQLLLGRKVIPLIRPFIRATVAKKVLGGRDNTAISEQFGRNGRIALKSLHHFAAIVIDDGWIFGIALIRASPTVIPHNGQRRREGPVNPGRGNFFGRGNANRLDQRRIIGGPQPDIVRKQGRSIHVAMPMHRVSAPQNRNLGRCLLSCRIYGGVIVAVRQTHPRRSRRMFIIIRPRSAAIQHGADKILRHLSGRNACDFRLNHLPDFFFHRHLTHDGGNFIFHRLNLLNVTSDGRPRRLSKSMSP